MSDSRAAARPSPFALVAAGLGLLGAGLLLLAPFLPMARITLLGETIEVGSDTAGPGWGIAVLGGLAAVLAGLGWVRRNPLWTAGVGPVAVAALGWSGWYAFSRLPELARLADSASLAGGGMAFVSAGPVLLISSLAAVVAAGPYLAARR